MDPVQILVASLTWFGSGRGFTFLHFTTVTSVDEQEFSLGGISRFAVIQEEIC